MIKQADLRGVVDARATVAELESLPDVAAYISAQALVKTRLEALKKRHKAGEECQAGRLTLAAKVVRSVSWEQLFSRMRLLPSIARALAGDEPARALLQQALDKDPAAEFVSERVTFDVVVA